MSFSAWVVTCKILELWVFCLSFYLKKLSFDIFGMFWRKSVDCSVFFTPKMPISGVFSFPGFTKYKPGLVRKISLSLQFIEIYPRILRKSWICQECFLSSVQISQHFLLFLLLRMFGYVPVLEKFHLIPSNLLRMLWFAMSIFWFHGIHSFVDF